eukprot:scaffold66070_cov28-Tisochrysis_lutea.AAC.2
MRTPVPLPGPFSAAPCGRTAFEGKASKGCRSANAARSKPGPHPSDTASYDADSPAATAGWRPMDGAPFMGSFADLGDEPIGPARLRRPSAWMTAGRSHGGFSNARVSMTFATRVGKCARVYPARSASDSNDGRRPTLAARDNDARMGSARGASPPLRPAAGRAKVSVAIFASAESSRSSRSPRHAYHK